MGLYKYGDAIDNRRSAIEKSKLACRSRSRHHLSELYGFLASTLHKT
jgi:hypothetical protein